MLKSNPLWRLTVASSKMYFRNFTAVFFSLLFPIIFLVVFGFIGQSGNITINIAYINRSQTPSAQNFDKAFGDLIINDQLDEAANKSRLFKNDQEVQTTLKDEGYDQALSLIKDKLNKSQLTAAVLVPENFGENGGGKINLLLDASDTQFTGVVKDTVNKIVGGLNNQVVATALGGKIPQPFSVTTESVQSSELTSVDYLVPGIIAFSIMSLGIFSVSQGFLYLKSSGALRRLHVAPLNPLTFLGAQSITRLIMTALNVLIMVGIGVLMFSFHIRGNLLEFIFFSILGSIMFLGMGFAIAGWAKDEDQAAPISNIIFFPMMFLSGTFFPRELFPSWLSPVTNYLPLTYVGDGLRDIANNAQHIWQLGPQLLGIAVWTVIIYLIAVRIFRWE